jgi:hypothetical protein
VHLLDFFNTNDNQGFVQQEYEMLKSNHMKKFEDVAPYWRGTSRLMYGVSNKNHVVLIG